ncbi:MAG: hypothetical protein NZ902_04950 [Acidilobaceae archaeon]|nr:hypothetical protein [Acidilobaceae archaeon]MCX8165916.1 hypothetical protein [Acidilobaceae archaeon]MDW7974559.1 hypothetical protein [Sulfolobales archaeon]
MNDLSMSRASLDEEVYLRSLTGYVVAGRLLKGFERVLIITLPDRICSSLSAAISSSLLAHSGYKGSLARILMYEDDRAKLVEKVRAALAEFKPDAVFIVFGGEERMSKVAEKAKTTVEALQEAGFSGALAIHVRTWLATKQLGNIVAEQRLASYLSSLREIRVFTADLQQKKFVFHKVKVENSAVKPQPYDEASLIDEHVELLKKSLPPPEQ